MQAPTETYRQEPQKIARAVDPKKNKKTETTNESGAVENNSLKTKYVPIPDDKFEATLKYGLEKYKEIWKSLADK
jgi:hypothetical protein